MRISFLKRLLLSLLSLTLGITFFVFPQSQIQVGYALLSADSGTRTPVATALFTYTDPAGILVSQAGVGAVEPISSGCIFVDQDQTETGVALVNPSSQSASVSLVLRNSSGAEVARKSISLPPGNHLARFVSEFFSDLPPRFVGSLTFESNQKLGAITLRQSTNVSNEVIYTTLPVVDLAQSATDTPIIFPQIAAGGGYTTQIILINGTAEQLRGNVSLYDDAGGRLPLELEGNETSQFSYEVGPHGTYRVELDRTGEVSAGYAIVTPEPGSVAPSGSAVFRYKENGAIVTEAGVGATEATTSARIFVDNNGSFTGVALANIENQEAAVTFSLFDRNGVSQETTTRTVSAKGHLAKFVNELFPGLGSAFTGLMEITSTTPVAPITLKLTINQRGDLVYTTLPVADLNKPPSSNLIVFPHIALGGGFSTRLILISTDKTKVASGSVGFFRSDSSAWVVPLGSLSASAFAYHVTQGGGLQFFPGNTAKLASIAIIDPSTNQSTTEIAVNEGNTLKVSLLVLDEIGIQRDDFVLNYTSIDPTIAAVDADGFITGKKAGFSTLTISSGGVIVTGTIIIVSVQAGVTGYIITGVVQDLAQRLYLAATGDNAILLAQDLRQAPEVYAGVRGTGGLKNDERLKSLFRKPGFLAFDQAHGTMYVSDGDNNVIRRVQPGPGGRVETLAGTVDKGSSDGTNTTARFNNPQGVVLDNRGFLWVVDSGNHTIRRINLSTGTVATVAGKPGSPGWADGKGDMARFNGPVGIAIETDSPAIDFLNTAPKPVSVVIADTGNGVIRRVMETGEVETIRSTAQTSAIPSKFLRLFATDIGAPVRFSSPTGIAVDPFGNIYVSEPASAQVKLLLQNGEVVSSTQAKTFAAPAGIAVIQGGKILVADPNGSAQEISYGAPVITSVTPSSISNRGGDRVTVKGLNFAPDTVIIAGGLIRDADVKDTQTITFTAPSLPSGLITLTVQNRGGLAQRPLPVNAASLASTPPGYITTVAGGTTYAGDGAPATSATIASPLGVAIDSAGNLFVADGQNNRIRKVSTATGIITSVAGTGESGYSGDDGPGTAAKLNGPSGIAVDASSNLFIADAGNCRVRKVDAATGIITTVAGTGRPSFSGDLGPATKAGLLSPFGVAIDAANNLIVADTGNGRIRKVDAITGVITTVAGNGTYGFSGDGGPATEAQLTNPEGIALDAVGNLFFADLDNQRIRKVDATTGIITTVAGTGERASSLDNIRATSASLVDPPGVAVDAAGNLFIADAGTSRVRRVDGNTGIISTVAGGFFGRDGGLQYPVAISLDAAGHLFVADRYGWRIVRVDAATGKITTVVGTGQRVTSGDNAPATAAQLLAPLGIALDLADNLLIADYSDHRIRKVDARTGVMTTVAGTGTQGSIIDPCCKGDLGPATEALLSYPRAVTVDRAGNIFIVDYTQIRRIDAFTGIITTVVGIVEPLPGFSGDDSLGTAARMNFPEGIALDAAGNLFIADTGNNRIRRVDAGTGIIATFAGSGPTGYGYGGFFGDNGPATAARLNFPEGIALDAAGNLFIADTNNNRVRRVDKETGIITTVAGTGTPNFSGDHGPATKAGLSNPSGVAIDVASNLIIADTNNNRVRRVEARTGIITTVAGSGAFGSSGDNGPASSAQLAPWCIAIDRDGNLFISDMSTNRIRAVRGPIP